MRLLLDTCTFLWAIDATGSLSLPARAALEDASNELFFHQASSLEIQIKHSLGRLSLGCAPAELIPQALAKHEIQYCALADTDIWHLAKLPHLHGDPFDRLLIAHALNEGMKLVTPDPEIHRYPIPIVW